MTHTETVDSLPNCDMRRDCQATITHIENKGWVYCTEHAMVRRAHGRRVRKLRDYELNRLRRGLQVQKY